MKSAVFLLFTGIFFVFSLTAITSAAETIDSFPQKGMVTMIDLGAQKCIPCKMMAPIMEKMEKVYQGKASIVFIDVWENREQATRFGIQAIPTQIFFDKDGKEVFRHTGFFSETEITAQLKKLGVPAPEDHPGN
ncbi:MAG: thioredoxin family protein [Proteobacteria bacterium]|nr:thioredoxin family protein [Pseudomonadota bacterium]